MSRELSLKMLVWQILPPQGPGLTRDEIRAEADRLGRTLTPHHSDWIFTLLRACSALRSDSRVPRRYWRGVVAREDVEGAESPREAWTTAMDAMLVALWPDPSLSVADLGRKVGGAHGRMLSKNAISGRANKLELPVRSTIAGMPTPAVATVPTVPTGRGISGSDALPAGHPLSWGPIVALTPCIPQGWPG